MKIYFKDQCHESLSDFLQFRSDNDRFGGRFIQVFFKYVKFAKEFFNG